jgi:hypothetical protein
MKQVKKLYYCPFCRKLQNRTVRDRQFQSYCESSGRDMTWKRVGAKKRV